MVFMNIKDKCIKNKVMKKSVVILVFALMFVCVYGQNKYDYVGDFSEGLARVYLNGKYGYIDKTGKETKCPHIYADGKYCWRCGEETDTDMVFWKCNRCGAHNDYDWRKCNECDSPK
jgi:hypothetical protein